MEKHQRGPVSDIIKIMLLQS